MRMRKLSLNEIESAVKEITGKINPVSVYAYGSWIRTDSKESSDADLLLVSEKNEVDFEFLKHLTERYKFLDLTILTRDEIKNGAHASFNSFHFINLLFSSILVYGEDILLKEFTKFPDFNSAVWRVQCILQRIRNVLSNQSKSHERFYWFRKLNHWLHLVISEFLFFTKGYYDPNLLHTKNKFEELFFRLNVENLEDLYTIFSKIKEMYLSYPYQYIRTRPGIFVLIRDKSNGYMMFERSDKRGFEFVKGGVEVGETFKDAALREIREEMGIEVDPANLIELPIALSFKFPLKDGYEIRIYKGFLMTGENTDLKNLTLDRFFSSARFMKLDEISSLASFPEY